jgi:HAMP domain-containing protein
MFRTIFHKLMAIFVVVLLVCFTFAAVISNISINRYVINQRTEVLNVYGERISSAFKILMDNRIDPTSSFIFNSLLEAVENNTSALIWVVDDRGNLLAYSSIPQIFAEKLHNNMGVYRLTEPKQYEIQETPALKNEIGSFYGLFDETGMQWLTVKIPFSFPNIIINNQPFRGNVMMHTPLPEIQKTGANILRIFLPAVFISLIISFVFVYILSKKITNPLKQMTEAARKIASGDWQREFSYTGNDEVAVLADSFNHMIKTLENLEKMRRDFVVNISHELRTPMTSINGFIEGILDGTIPQEQHNKYLNIKTATEELNHSVIEPGDVFSINEKLGKRTEEKGYKEAPILQGGKKGKGVGGGICQISSTIYNAALKADMKIIERHRHSEPVPYVPEGKDAAVVYNSKDFRFKNTKDYPVEIIISVSEDEITVKLYKKENKED